MPSADLQYGSCKAPEHVQDLESLKTYLLETSQAVGKRNKEAANAIQQLAAEVVDSGPKAQLLAQEMNETRGYLQSCKEKTLQHMVEITELKQKANSHQQQLQQKQDASKQHEDAAKAAKDELEKVKQQLKEKEEQLQKNDEELKKQQGSAGSVQPQALPADTAAARLHALNTAGLQCSAVNDQEVRQ